MFTTRPQLKRRRFLVCGTAAFIVTACSRERDSSTPAFAQGATKTYRLAVGDRLRIAVFGHSEHTGEFQIDSAGNVNFPLLGEVKASGLTVGEMKEKLRRDLGAKYLVDPRLSVEVLNYRPFFILGEVKTAGKYSYEPGLTVRKAVAMAGGFTRRAAKSEATLRRPTREGMKVYSVPLETKLLPGDTVEIHRRLF